MESSNSGSIQSSSSGADNEDYSSHAESFSSFLNLPPPHPPAQLMASHHNSGYSTATTSPFFDPLSPFFAHFPPFPPPPPDPNPFVHFVDVATRPKPASSGRSSPSPAHPNCTTGAVDVSATSASSISNTLSPVQQSDHAAAVAATAPRGGSKKRSRASRRAPTTVLTTDTSNFRAMVQQFTGFPAPPFAPSSSSSAYSRPRLDLFNLGASASPASPYNNLLRPFPQKFQHPLMGSSSSSSSLIDAIASIARSGVGHLNMPLNTAGSASASAPPPFHASASSSRNLQFPPSDLQSRVSPIHAQNASIDSHSILQPQDISKLYAPQSSSSSSSMPSFRAQQQGPSGGALGTAPQGVKTIHRTDGLSSWIGRQSTESRDEARQELTNQSFGAYKASE